jgi:hypothetical protein
MKGSMTMKLTKTFLMICLIAIAAAPVWAQRGQSLRNGARNGVGNCMLLQSSATAQPLSTVEEEPLMLLREEEKLARDVYQALFAKWGVRIFNNIAVSEQRHFDAIGILIERYGLTDPAQPTAGAFNDPELQQLYFDLIAKGNISLLDALQVGVAIEEKDIKDLKAAMAITDNRDVLTVYSNLLNGSLNHLSAFDSHIDAVSSK